MNYNNTRHTNKNIFWMIALFVFLWVIQLGMVDFNLNSLQSIENAFNEPRANETTIASPLSYSSTCGDINDWIPLPSSGGVISSGNYYLDGNVTLSTNIAISSGVVNIDLNGNILWGALNSDQSIFTVTGGTLNIYDCDTSNKVHNYKIKEVKATATQDIYYNSVQYNQKLFQRYYDFNDIGDGVIVGGIITGGHKFATKTDLKSNFNYAGGGSAILIGNTGGTVNFYGGTLSGNTSTTLSQWGGKRQRGGTVGVMDGGTFNFHRGQIVGNSGRYGGTGIYVFGSSSSPARVNIYGGIIEDNYSFDTAYNFSNTSSMFVGGAGIATDNVGNGASIVSLSGAPRIVNNHYYDYYTNQYISTNLSYSTESVNSIKILGELYTEVAGVRNYASIGLWGGAGEQLTSNYTTSGNTHEDVNKIFFADNITQAVAYNTSNGELKYVTADLKTLTYDANHGTNETSNISVVDKISVSETMFTKTGHTFSHWNTSPDGSGTTYLPKDILTLSSNQTIYAIWTKSTYKIDYWTNGGSFNTSVQTAYTYGDTVTLPIPVWTGKTFEGWYDNAMLSGDEITEIDATTFDNQVFYAKWGGVAQHTILSTSGDNGTIYPLGSIIYDGTVQNYLIIPMNGYKVATFTVNGEDKKMDIVNHNYSVSGITSDTQIDVTFEKILPSDIAVYANSDVQGTISPKGYTVVSNGSSLTYTITPNLGYQIKDVKVNGVSMGAVSTVTLTNITSTQSVYAEFMILTAVNSAITFNLNGGNTILGYDLPQTYTEGVGLTLPNNQKIVRVGYVFEGWYDNENLSGQTVQWISLTDVGAKTYWAKWTVEFISITFNSNLGSAVSTISQAYGSNVSQPANPTKLGYTFGGWYSDEALSSAYTFDTMPAEDITLYAKWSINTYNITFNSNLGSAVSSISQAYGSNVSQPANPTKLGYTFVGWYSDEALSSAYTFDTMPAEDITLYAKWSINTYNITFNSNLGSAVSSISQAYGSNVSQPANPTKLGYTFGGWYSDEALSSAYTFDTMPAEDITLYAKWSINTYNITFNSNLGSAVSSISQVYGSNVSQPANPTKLGYTFGGWYSDEALSSAYTFDTMPAEDITLYAKWSINTYNITFNSNLGSAVSSISQAYGTNVSQPANPTKLGYTFGGWYSDEALSSAYTFNTMPAEDITLYAKWLINTYTITFDTKGGNMVEPLIQPYGSAIVLPTTPTKTGHLFNGWKQNVPSMMPAGDMTIEACWIKVSTTDMENNDLEMTGLLEAIDLTMVENMNGEIMIQFVRKHTTEVNLDLIELIQSQLTKHQQYAVMDISVIIKVEGQSDILITDLTQNIQITLQLGELEQGHKNYQIIRIHDGQVEMLDCTYDEKLQTITFETNQFSSYVLVYEKSSNGNWAWWSLLLLLPMGFVTYKYRHSLLALISKKNN